MGVSVGGAPRCADGGLGPVPGTRRGGEVRHGARGAAVSPRLAGAHLRHVGGGDPWAYHPHLVAWLVIGGVALAYALGVRHLARSHGPGALPGRRQLWCLAGGLVALAGALAWPHRDLAAHWSLGTLVVQRLLFTLAAAPLLLAAAPEPLLATLTRPARIDAAVEVLTRPVVAIVTFTVVAVGTLLTPAVAARRRPRRGGR